MISTMSLCRECQEEVGAEVAVNNDPAITVQTEGGETVERFYDCCITGGHVGTGSGPEFQPSSDYIGNHGLEWISLTSLQEMNIYYRKKPSNTSSRGAGYEQLGHCFRRR